MQASVKNFQIVHESDTDYIIMQVSRIIIIIASYLTTGHDFSDNAPANNERRNALKSCFKCSLSAA